MEKPQEDFRSIWSFIEEPKSLDEKILRDFHGHAPIVDEKQIDNPKIDKNCADYFNSIIDKDDFVRIAIEGGGCSGFQYAFYINESPIEDSDIIINESPKVVIDCESIKYMKGATIKYETAPFNQRVYVDNPGAKASCGCGESFSYEL